MEKISLLGQPNQIIRIPHHISRTFIVNHPDWVFVFGHDLMHRGCLGQAWDFYNEPNTFPVPTLYKYCANPVYFQDTNYDEWVGHINEAIKSIPTNRSPIIVARKIGEGCARMQEFAPRLLTYIQAQLNVIATPYIIDYAR